MKQMYIAQENFDSCHTALDVYCRNLESKVKQILKHVKHFIQIFQNFLFFPAGREHVTENPYRALDAVSYSELIFVCI